MTTDQQVNVRVELFADLRQYNPPGVEGWQELELPVGSKMIDIIERFGIPTDYEVTIGRNGEQAHEDDLVVDGDEIMLFSPMEGGSPNAG